MFGPLMLPLCEHHSLRCIALDRRGFCKSDWTGPSPSPNSPSSSSPSTAYDTFAADTVSILTSLSLPNTVMISNSMACSDMLLAYNALTLIRETNKGYSGSGHRPPPPSSGPPSSPASSPTARPANPASCPASSARASRHRTSPASSAPSKSSPRATLRPNLPPLVPHPTPTLPLLILHGDQGTGMPYEASTAHVEKLVLRARVKMYAGEAHGLAVAHAEMVVQDFVGFVKGL